MTAPKKPRPALDDLDLSDLPGPAFAPADLSHTDPAEIARRRSFASQLENPDFIARSADSGMVKVVRPTPEPALPRSRRSDEPSFTVRLPDYLQQDVRLAAVHQKTTVRLILMQALRGAGFEIHDEDMTDDRGIVAKLRSRARR